MTTNLAVFPRHVPSRRGFTLIELLVVMGIIGVLVASLVVSMSGVTESAKAAKCMNNIHQLAVAWRNTATGSGSADSAAHYPPAGSYEYSHINKKRERVFNQVKGWISGAQNRYDHGGEIKAAVGITETTFDSNEEQLNFCITNGVVWEAINRERSAYLCPIQADVCRKHNKRVPGWSYVMNPQFGYNNGKIGWRSQAVGNTVTLRTKSALNQWGDGTAVDAFDRILLFAEIPALTVGNVTPVYGGWGTVLDYPNGYSMGFNHKSGKRYLGHVAFADGHVERFIAPSDGNAVDLTRWLCEGCTVRNLGTKYECEFSPIEN